MLEKDISGGLSGSGVLKNNKKKSSYCRSQMEKCSRRLRRRGRVTVVVLAAGAVQLCASLLEPTPVMAGDTDLWNIAVSVGNWSSANWHPESPAAGDIALIEPGATINAVTLDVSTPALLAGVEIGSTSSGIGTLNQTTNFNITAAFESIGLVSGYGTYGMHNQYAGTNTFSGFLDVGDDGGTCTYNLQSSAVINLTGTGGGLKGLFVGDAGEGTFNQTGGTINSSVPVYLGYQSAGIGTFLQSGGKDTIGTASANQTLSIGQTAGSLAAYNASSSASLTVNGNASVGGSSIASGGSGVFNISDSAYVDISGQLTIWNTPGTAVNLNGGALLINSLNTSSGSVAKFNWTGGALNIFGSQGLTLDNGSNANDSYPLGSNITLSRDQALGVLSGNLIVGNTGAASVTQTGTSTNVQVGSNYGPSQNLSIGSTVSSSGTYLLENDSVLNIIGNEIVGDSATGSYFHGALASYGGSFFLAGGFDIVSRNLIVANAAGSSGYFELDSGTLTVNGNTIIGNGGAGIFYQYGGTHNVFGTPIPANLYVGNYGNGIYNMYGGEVFVNCTLSIAAGAGSVGVFNEVTQATQLDYVSVTNETIGDTGNGSMLVSNADDYVSASLIVGNNGSGSLTISNDSTVSTGGLNIAAGSGSSGQE